MKTLCTLLIIVLASTTGFAQNTYLKIIKSDTTSISYPPGTKFELKNKDGYIIFKNSEEPGLIKIDEPYTLYVYPSWKKDADIFKLTTGKVKKVLTSSYSINAHKKYAIESNGVTAEYTVTNSKDLKGEKNLVFKLSNGIYFEYQDGTYRAYLNDEQNYLNIENKYLIESKFGILKLSFNPKNGKVWWVFESAKH